MRNLTDRPVEVTGVENTCTCTVAEPRQFTVPARGVYELELRLNLTAVDRKDAASPLRGLAVEVVPDVKALPEGMPLRIVGPEPDGGTRARLSALARGKDVTFLHRLDDTALVREYQRALCVVLPSVYRTADGRRTEVPELLGQTLLEGMACGIPAVCTRVASMPEVVDDEVTGFVVPPNDPPALGDRLNWLRTHPDKVARMGAAARRRVLDHFTWPAVVSRCLARYEAASSRSASRSTVAAHEARS